MRTLRREDRLRSKSNKKSTGLIKRSNRHSRLCKVDRSKQDEKDKLSSHCVCVYYFVDCETYLKLHSFGRSRPIFNHNTKLNTIIISYGICHISYSRWTYHIEFDKFIWNMNFPVTCFYHPSSFLRARSLPRVASNHPQHFCQLLSINELTFRLWWIRRTWSEGCDFFLSSGGAS